MVPYTGATKDVNLGEHSETLKNLIVNGAAKINGELAPIKTYTFHTEGEYGIDYTLYIYTISHGLSGSGFNSFFGRLDQHINGVEMYDSSDIIGSCLIDSNNKLYTIQGNLFSLANTDVSQQYYQHIICRLDNPDIENSLATVTITNFAYISDVANRVPYTGATKDINIGNHSFKMSSVFTVGNESSVYTQIVPDSISLKNPIGTLSIGISSLGVNGTTIY